MASKSANYCCSYISGGTALLLLCEAELGDPMQELVHASYTAGEDAKAKGMVSTWGQGSTGPSQWKDASCVHPSLAGVKMVSPVVHVHSQQRKSSANKKHSLTLLWSLARQTCRALGFTTMSIFAMMFRRSACVTCYVFACKIWISLVQTVCFGMGRRVRPYRIPLIHLCSLTVLSVNQPLPGTSLCCAEIFGDACDGTATFWLRINHVTLATSTARGAFERCHTQRTCREVPWSQLAASICIPLGCFVDMPAMDVAPPSNFQLEMSRAGPADQPAPIAPEGLSWSGPHRQDPDEPSTGALHVGTPSRFPQPPTTQLQARMSKDLPRAT